ncbi:MAG TPA: condensation domain-containing protein [Steroidobacteraceae bacterium]
MDSQNVPFTVQQRYFWSRPGGDAGLHTLIPFPFLLLGPLDRERLGKCLQQLIGRHDALRTRIVMVDGAPPRQKFLVPAPYQLEQIDLFSPDKSETEIDMQLQSELRTRFNRRIVLNADSLFEVTLFRLAGARHALVLWVHHILADAHAPSLLLQDLWTLYATSASTGAGGEPTQYSQYCAWQQQILESWLAEQRPYWTQRLAGAKPIQWPAISSGPLEPNGVSDGVTCMVSATATASLRAQAKRSRKQLSLYALTAYAAMVRDCCDQSDLVLTASFTGRLAPQHLRTVGFLVQPLYLRVRSSPGATFESLLELIGKEYFGALFHRDFGQTVLENPDLGAGALFQWFPADWALTPPSSLNLEILVQPLTFKHRGFFHEKYKFGIFVFETADRLSIHGAFRPDCIHRDTVERLLKNICGHLEQQAANGA